MHSLNSKLSTNSFLISGVNNGLPAQRADIGLDSQE